MNTLTHIDHMLGNLMDLYSSCVEFEAKQLTNKYPELESFHDVVGSVYVVWAGNFAAIDTEIENPILPDDVYNFIEKVGELSDILGSSGVSVERI